MSDRRGRTRRVVLALAIVALAACNQPAFASAGAAATDYWTDRPAYKARYGQWETLPVPRGMRVNAIHAALLPTGKVLIIAGSGNDRTAFQAGRFRSVLWDPADNRFTNVPTPADMFCAGHAFLPNGDLLVAGGTRRFEVLEDKVTRAAGVMTVRYESPDGARRTLPKGTAFTSPTGVTLRSTDAVVIEPATKTEADGRVTVTASQVRVWVEADREGAAAVIAAPAQYRIEGLTGSDTHDLYGMGGAFTLEKQNFQGIDNTYVFNVRSERYERVGDMSHARWYPTLVGLPDGKVLASSGLDAFGDMLEGQTEIYDPVTREWTERPDLQRYFPTYPALFLMAGSPGRLFYSGSNSGFGPEDQGRAPGIWDLATNTFKPVPGLRDADLLETSGSVLLPPAQHQKVMVIGGGGVGESARSTARTSVVDLTAAQPHFSPGPDLPDRTRYPSSVVLPDDTVLTTGGSRDYRGKGRSDHHHAEVYHPDTNQFTRAAAPAVGRNYHSEALLLPDGRVITLGSDPLFADGDNTRPGRFEQRIEIFTPAYLHRGARPTVGDGPTRVSRGETVRFPTPDAGAVRTARLIRPSAVTHVTDVEQRSVALALHGGAGAVHLDVPTDPALLPSGWYMLFLVDGDGVPSVGRWVHVVDDPTGTVPGGPGLEPSGLERPRNGTPDASGPDACSQPCGAGGHCC